MSSPSREKNTETHKNLKPANMPTQSQAGSHPVLAKVLAGADAGAGEVDYICIYIYIYIYAITITY